MNRLAALTATISLLLANAARSQGAPISPWLISLQPVIERMADDAETAVMCGYYGPSTTQEDIDITLEEMPGKTLSGPDLDFAKEAITKGMASAVVDFRHGQEAACSHLNASRLLAVKQHFQTPIPQWHERR